MRAKSEGTNRNYRDAVKAFVEVCGFKSLRETASKADEKNRLYFHGVKSFLELFEKNINWNRVSRPATP
ncbi:MAG: hypothetical protein QXW02_02135 [Nitrososphaerota archaeon]